MDEITKFDYSKKISEKRNSGRIDEAIRTTIEAKKHYPDENIFEKLLGDLYFQKTSYESAGEAYLYFLEKIGDKVQYGKHFIHFLQRYSKAVETQELAAYCHKVERFLDNGKVNTAVIPGICEILAEYTELPEITLFQDDNYFKKAVEYLRKLKNSCKLYILYYKILSLEHSKKNKRIDKYIVSMMEKREQYKEALQLLEKVLNYDRDKVAVRTLFRICRKLNDYSSAEHYILRHPGIKEQQNFNILYELVYYYAKIGDVEERNETLEKMEECGKNSIPILRTLYNFYLQFGMLDRAVLVKEKITAQEHVAKKTKSEIELQEDNAAFTLLLAIKEMFEELEHSRKLISMGELLKGFSHELGQPITNIRYGIQLYQMKMEKGVHTEDELSQLFVEILAQTSRIKKMLSRFSPLVNEKEGVSQFSAAKEIKEVFQEFTLRLEKENIVWDIIEDTDFTLYGDRIKFHQIFYNLIGNAIFAVQEKKIKGHIIVKIEQRDNSCKITFEDNGVGIDEEYLDKIFEPFFTTKDHFYNEDGGGEGLGLYIVWNIVQMFNGNIRVDKQYRDGARFIIEMTKKGKGEEHE